ncbi:MAG: hypothetical protein ISS95_01485, partial [Candidatus Aenigmarchaeota archaeon]|nr:hypothetical protein [Candidatus Aenigmarchaeota archaeon]
MMGNKIFNRLLALAVIFVLISPFPVFGEKINENNEKYAQEELAEPISEKKEEIYATTGKLDGSLILSTEEMFESVVQAGKDYEEGKLNFAQLNVYTEITRERMADMLSYQKFSEEDREFEGFSGEQVKKIFGEPTREENWVWVVNKERSMKLDNPVPRWEKTIFNGNKIKIILNAWPQVLEQNEKIGKPFYWIGFETRFKSQQEFNFEERISEIESLAEAYKDGNGDGELLAKKMIDAEQLFRTYMEENQEDCLQTIDKIVKGNNDERQVLKRRGALYRSKNFDITFEMNSCEDCEWKWLNFHYWLDPMNRKYGIEGMKVDVEVNKEVYERMSLEELYEETENILEQIKNGAELYDKSRTPVFVEWFFRAQAVLDVISETINQKVNDWQLLEIERAGLMEEREERMDKIFWGIVEPGSGTMERYDEKESKRRLITINETVQNSYCEGRYEDCGSRGMRCENMQCVSIPESYCSEGEEQWETCSGEYSMVVRRCMGNAWQEVGRCPEIREEIPLVNEEQKIEAESFPEKEIEEGFENEEKTEKLDESIPEDISQESAGEVIAEEKTKTVTGKFITGTAKEEEFAEGETDEQLRSQLNFLHPRTWEGNMEYADTCMYNGCNAHEWCNEEKGWCECLQGWFNNNGDWMDGCEAKEWKPCESNMDCAQARCNSDGWGIEKWECVKEEEREEERGGFEMNGGCSFGQSGNPDFWIDFNGWGEQFDKLRQLKEGARAEMGTEWCKREYEDRLSKRLELQKSFNKEFMDWFFKDFIEKEPGDFELYMRAIGSTFWQLVNANRELSDSMRCMNKKEWDERIVPVAIVYESSYGKIEINEEWIYTDFFDEDEDEDFSDIYVQEEYAHEGGSVLMLTPTMRMWIFPPKEELKKIIAKEFEGGMTGPEGKAPGPSASEREMMRRDPRVMDTINSISESFGGSGEFIFQVLDEEEPLFRMLFMINPDIIMDVKPAMDYEGEADATLSVDFDFFYDIVYNAEKEARSFRIERPEWDKRGERGEKFNEIKHGIKIFTGIFSGVMTGNVRVDPVSVIPNLGFMLGRVFNLM